MAGKSPRRPRTETVETRPAELRRAVTQRVNRRIAASGELHLPALPALEGTYFEMLSSIFAALGRPLTKDEEATLRRNLAEKLEEGFRYSRQPTLRVQYVTNPFPAETLQYVMTAHGSTLEEQYATWTTTREGPLFGAYPDAKVMALAATLGEPADVPCLDVGAGTGRNTLPLARRGHPTDAVELAPALAELLEKSAAAESLTVRVVRANLLEDGLPRVREGYKLVVVAEVTSDFRGPQDLRRLMERFTELLLPGGVGLMNVFLYDGGYTPDRLSREVGTICWSTAFTRRELTAALDGLPLAIASDEPAVAFEREHLPEGAWPQTTWFEQWASGRDAYHLEETRPPIELRWVVVRRT